MTSIPNPVKPTRPSLSHGLVWQYGSYAVQAIVQVATLAVLSRYLTPVDFGTATTVLIVSGLGTMLTQAGLGPALIQRTSISPGHITAAYSSSLAIGAVVAGVIWIISPPLGTFFSNDEVVPLLRLASISMVAASISSVSESLLYRSFRIFHAALISVASYAIGYGLVSTYLAITGMGATAIVAGVIAQFSMKAMLGVMATGIPRGRWSASHFRELAQFGGGFTLARFANYLAGQADFFVIGKLGGPSPLGFYSRAYQLYSMPATFIGQGLERVLFPHMSAAKDDSSRSEQLVRRSLSLIIWSTSVFTIWLIVNAEEVVRIVLGAGWGEVVLPVQCLAISLVFRTCYKIGDAYAKAQGAVFSRAFREVVYFALVTIGTGIGMHIYGIVGGAIGVSVAVVLNFVLAMEFWIRSAKVDVLSLLGEYRRLPWIIAVLIFITVVLRIMSQDLISTHAGIVVSGLVLLTSSIVIIRFDPNSFGGLRTKLAFLRKVKEST